MDLKYLIHPEDQLLDQVYMKDDQVASQSNIRDQANYTLAQKRIIQYQHEQRFKKKRKSNDEKREKRKNSPLRTQIESEGKICLLRDRRGLRNEPHIVINTLYSEATAWINTKGEVVVECPWSTCQISIESIYPDTAKQLMVYHMFEQHYWDDFSNNEHIDKNVLQELLSTKRTEIDEKKCPVKGCTSNFFGNSRRVLDGPMCIKRHLQSHAILALQTDQNIQKVQEYEQINFSCPFAQSQIYKKENYFVAICPQCLKDIKSKQENRCRSYIKKHIILMHYIDQLRNHSLIKSSDALENFESSKKLKPKYIECPIKNCVQICERNSRFIHFIKHFNLKYELSNQSTQNSYNNILR